jgi:hypothetical protein
VGVAEAVRDKVDRVGRGFEWLGVDLMVTCADDGDAARVRVRVQVLRPPR